MVMDNLQKILLIKDVQYFFLRLFYKMKKSTKGHMRSSDGHYHIKGRKFQQLTGSRAQVHHGTAYKTTGGLVKPKLMMNKHGRIVSRKKHATAKREKRLEKAGYFAKKGTFGAIEKGKAGTTRKRRRTRRRR